MNNKLHYLLILYFISATLSIAASQIILFITALIWGYGLIKKPETFKISKSGLDIFLLLYILASIISIIFSTNIITSLQHVKHFTLLLIFIFGLQALTEGARVRFYINLLVLGGLINCFYALFKYIALSEGGLSKRLHGFIRSWMTFSGFLMIILLLSIAKIIWIKSIKIKFIYFLFSIFFFYIILLSMTRSSWVGLFFGLMILSFLKSKKLFLALMIMIILGGLIIYPYIPADIKERFKSIADLQNQTNKERIYMAMIAWNIIKEHPFLGIGPGNLSGQLKNYVSDGIDPNWSIPHLHNNLLQIAADKGLLGLVSWIAIFIKWLFDSIKAFYKHRNFYPDLIAGAISVVVAFLISGLFEYNFGDSEILMLLLFIMAIPYALTKYSDNDLLEK